MADSQTVEQPELSTKAVKALGCLVWKWVAPFIGLAIVLVFFEAVTPEKQFLQLSIFKLVASQTVIVGICAVGMTFIMVGGGIDLSVGSVMALSGVAAALALDITGSSWAAVIVAILTGSLCGFINALIITGLRIIPFVTTLGMLSIARGTARALAKNEVVRPGFEQTANLNNFVQPLRSEAWWDFAHSVWVMLAVAVVASIVLNFTVFGRRTYALGSNEEASRYSGIAINRQKIWLYTLGGMLTGLAGVFLLANTTEGDPTAAVGMELQVIAAVVIGGGSLMGGAGSVLGTLIGAFMLTFLVNGCTFAGWANWVQEIIIGAIIILAVALDYFRRKAPG